MGQLAEELAEGSIYQVRGAEQVGSASSEGRPAPSMRTGAEAGVAHNPGWAAVTRGARGWNVGAWDKGGGSACDSHVVCDVRGIMCVGYA